ncbi:lipid-A-disaccharide synthase [Rhodospirillaceae bacterium]|nr:lipid-A-disaccharide synthase [Rhodospirillaceae bacterium]MBT6305680.1 lipid-A-disaccharide synthase [Rhodospirillaceae bacterium]MDC1442049.1 lipid-A-disaccharide synthase [Rhodospirillaceae bacterium]
MIENDDYSGNDPLFYIIAGEVSGDALGAGIMRSLKEKTLGKARFAGIGGSQMSSEGLISLFRMEELSVIGIVGVIPRIPKFLKMIKETVKDIFRKDPVALITIDSKGFTLRVAKQVHARQKTKQGKIKLLHMVAPTVWAWRPGRAKEISKYLDHLMALFPFEPEYFTCHGLKTTFIGHPANETKKANGSRFRKSFSIPNDVMVLSLLPGSRSSEVNMLLPVFEETILELRKSYVNLHIVIPVVPSVEDEVKSITSKWNHDNVMLVGNQCNQDLFAASDFAIAASGTVTLELALAEVPTVVVYKGNAVNALIGHCLVNRDAIVLPNRILERPIFPLLLQNECNPQALVTSLMGLINTTFIGEEMKLASTEIRKSLNAGNDTSSNIAAQVIISELDIIDAVT